VIFSIHGMDAGSVSGVGRGQSQSQGTGTGASRILTVSAGLVANRGINGI